MIEIKGLTKKFDNNFVALDNVDLVIPEGTAFGLLGSNGAGKSTILRIISGIYKNDSGTAQIDGEDIFDNVAVKQKVFFINDETVQFSKFILCLRVILSPHYHYTIFHSRSPPLYYINSAQCPLFLHTFLKFETNTS